MYFERINKKKQQQQKLAVTFQVNGIKVHQMKM